MSAPARPRDNRSSLVTVAVRGRVALPRVEAASLHIDREGRAFLLPGTGGVHPDVHAGDPVSRWAADHLMPGASVEDWEAPAAEPGSLHLLACVGNRVRDAAGSHLGTVAGKRGGLAPGFLPPNLVSVEAPATRLERLVPGDVVVVEACGRGLALADWPELHPLNLSPAILDALPLREASGRLEFAVRAVAPSRAAGAGIGQDAWIGDLEVTDASLLSPAGVALAFGDLVAFEAIDGRYGRYYRPGIVSVGVVAHGPSPAPGHGIGVTILLAGPAAQLAVVHDDGATIGPILRELAEGPRGPGEPGAGGGQ
jgi:hypothetical protein